MPESVKNTIVTSLQEEKVFDCLEGWSGYNNTENLLRVFPVPLVPQTSFVVLIGYHNYNTLTSAENKRGGSISAGLPSFYTVVVSAYSSVLAAAAEDKMETALRIFGHETGQLTAGLASLRMVYLEKGEDVRELSKEKAEQICEDIEGYVHQLILLSKQAKILLSAQLEERRLFSAHDELLPKWRSTYRLESKKKILEFVITEPESAEEAEVYGDHDLLEQLIYNLVNNAVKYCHRGTKIQLECTGHTLKVTNYGLKLEGNPVYGLYQRGLNVTGIEGLGIGLFLAKEIAVAHGGTISDTCKWVSNFNVPLIEPYINARILRGDDPFIKKLKDELRRLKNSGRFSQVVATGKKGGQKYSNPTRRELINKIKAETYEVTFLVEIPCKE